jgi:hypothetical protein
MLIPSELVHWSQQTTLVLNEFVEAGKLKLLLN